MKQWYVGLTNNKNQMVAFCSIDTPNESNYDNSFVAVIGPFKTRRAALWVEKHGLNNPHFQHVNDAERLSKH